MEIEKPRDTADSSYKLDMEGTSFQANYLSHIIRGRASLADFGLRKGGPGQAICSERNGVFVFKEFRGRTSKLCINSNLVPWAIHGSLLSSNPNPELLLLLL